MYEFSFKKIKTTSYYFCVSPLLDFLFFKTTVKILSFSFSYFFPSFYVLPLSSFSYLSPSSFIFLISHHCATNGEQHRENIKPQNQENKNTDLNMSKKTQNPKKKKHIDSLASVSNVQAIKTRKFECQFPQELCLYLCWIISNL